MAAHDYGAALATMAELRGKAIFVVSSKGGHQCFPKNDTLGVYIYACLFGPGEYISRNLSINNLHL